MDTVRGAQGGNAEQPKPLEAVVPVEQSTVEQSANLETPAREVYEAVEPIANETSQQPAAETAAPVLGQPAEQPVAVAPEAAPISDEPKNLVQLLEAVTVQPTGALDGVGAFEVKAMENAGKTTEKLNEANAA